MGLLHHLPALFLGICLPVLHSSRQGFNSWCHHLGLCNLGRATSLPPLYIEDNKQEYFLKGPWEGFSELIYKICIKTALDSQISAQMQLTCQTASRDNRRFRQWNGGSHGPGVCTLPLAPTRWMTLDKTLPLSQLQFLSL